MCVGKLLKIVVKSIIKYWESTLFMKTTKIIENKVGAIEN